MDLPEVYMPSAVTCANILVRIRQFLLTLEAMDILCSFLYKKISYSNTKICMCIYKNMHMHMQICMCIFAKICKYAYKC